MKKIMSLLLTISIIFSTNIIIYGLEDEPSDWAKEDVMEAIKCNYVPEHLQNNYQQPITREEFAELFVTAIFADYNKSYDSCHFDTKSGWDFQKLTPKTFLSKVTTTTYFTDTNNPYIKIANILGIVDGVGDHKFNPDGLITREQAAIMIVNYLQTIDSGNRKQADKELSDINEVSSWAKSAVRCVYGMGYLKGTKPPMFNDAGIVKKGYFDSKAYLTREQAIKIIDKAGMGKHLLGNLLLRGYIKVTMDDLMSGFEIDGNTVKMIRSGFDSKYTLGMKYFEELGLEEYTTKYTSEEIDALSVMPIGTIHNMCDNENIDRVLSGKIVTYDYTVFTITYNEPGYLAIFRKSENYDYLAGGYILVYRDKEKKTHYVECQAIIEHE